MPFNVNGFLGSEINLISDKHNEEHRELFEFSREINKFAYAIRDRINITADDQRSILIGIIYIKIINAVQGSIIMYQLGLDSEAKVLTRSSLESLFYLKSIISDECFHNYLIKENKINNKKILTRIKDYPKVFESLQGHPLLDNYHKICEEIKLDELRSINIKDIAIKADMLPEYLYIYTSLSDAVHLNIRGLSEKCVADEEGNIKYINCVPSTKDIEMILCTNFDIIIKTIIAVNRYYKLLLDNEIHMFNTKFAELYERIAKI